MAGSLERLFLSIIPIDHKIGRWEDKERNVKIIRKLIVFFNYLLSFRHPSHSRFLNISLGLETVRRMGMIVSSLRLAVNDQGTFLSRVPWDQPPVKELPTFPFPSLLLGCNRQAKTLSLAPVTGQE